MYKAPLSRISQLLRGLRSESYYVVPLSDFSEEETYNEDMILSCYGSNYDHIQMNLSNADIINPYYNQSKTHAIEIHSDIDEETDVKYHHLIIKYVLPLTGRSTVGNLYNALSRRSVPR